jgi:hypothetical protein
MIREGELPAVKIGGRLLIAPADVDTLLAQSRTPSRELAGGLRGLERSTAGMRATDKRGRAARHGRPHGSREASP